MATGGGDVVPVSPRAEQPAAKRRRTAAGQRHLAQAATSLPLDVIVEIAARSDPATLVRCAATCRAVRRRIAEDANLRDRLRLGDTGRFVLPLLRCYLAGTSSFKNGMRKTSSVYMVDTTTTAADATTSLVEATFVSAAAEAENFLDPEPIDSRGGLVLVRAMATTDPSGKLHQMLLVCNPATGRRLVLPPDPASFPRHDGGSGIRSYLLATDSAGGSPVVLVANAKNIRVWEQRKRAGKKGNVWKVRPKVLVERETILGFNDEVAKVDERMEMEEGWRRTKEVRVPWLVCFAERSGAVLLETHRGRCLFWLDLHSKKIVRCFSDSSFDPLQCAHVRYCPYEEDLSSWVAANLQQCCC